MGAESYLGFGRFHSILNVVSLALLPTIAAILSRVTRSVAGRIQGPEGDQVKRLKEVEAETPACWFRSHAGQHDPCRDREVKLLKPACVDHAVEELGMSESRACRVLGQHGYTQRKIVKTPDDKAA